VRGARHSVDGDSSISRRTSEFLSPLILLIIESTEQHYYIIMQFRSQTEGFGSGISAAMLGSGGGYVEELG
jgi:hypothetical protein